MKDKFIEIFKNNIKREGADKLLDWLLTTDFFTAPASTKYHNAKEGGLCEHSINVYNRLVDNLQKEYGDNWQNKCSIESATIIGLLHDVCKVDYFCVEKKNIKVYKESGSKVDSKGRYDWEEKEVYAVDDKLPYGHGEKSVYILSGFIKLTRTEAMAINWHMGAFDSRVKGGSYALADAFYNYPIALITHVADIEATYLDEER